MHAISSQWKIFYVRICCVTLYTWVTWCRSWLRHCATSQNVAGSIPDGVTGIFHWHNPSCRTVALGSTQPVSEMSTRNISCGVKAAGAWGWQTYHLHVPIVLRSRNLIFLEPSGPVQACNEIALPLRHTLGHDEFLDMLQSWYVLKLFIQTIILSPYRVRAIIAVALREMETVPTETAASPNPFTRIPCGA